ncbi:MAG TPA: ComEC/Rec2 family competence protein [Candidatus Paceibacterota bacterium]|nr:ComEC/Rec2 family competence protein [Candidatus Paceibacterota bacterium]HPT18065.1 ComEC/Rec2 family competence protein [Candidatus Paceibacterota bacterium]
MRDKIFFAICFGFIFGVFLRSFVSINFYTTILFGIISFAILLFFILISKNKYGIVFGFFILATFLGILRFNFSDKIDPILLDEISGQTVIVGEKINLSGIVIDEPSQKENTQSLVIKTKTGNKILVTTGRNEIYQYGEKVSLFGKLEKPENFTTDQGKVFDYVNYLRKDGIHFLMKYPKIKFLASGEGNKIKATLFQVKEKFLEKINTEIVEPENLLMGGLILGERASFSEELRKNFINTGTIHIVALSGYNITIIAEWIMKLFMFILAPLSFGSIGPQNFAIGFGIFSIFLFILMTGASSTAIRAGVMSVLALLARATGRNYDVVRALIFAGVVMLIFNPFLLIYDVSFQLSFLATIAVIFISPRFEKYFTWITTRFGLRDIISVTSATYIFVLPFILYKMGNLSLVALPANILVLPFIPMTMFFGFLTGVFGMVWYVLAIPLGAIAQILLSYELWVIDSLARLPFASLSISNFPLLLTIAIYGYFTYILFGRSIKKFLFLNS